MPLGRDPASARPSRDDEQPDEALGLRRARAASLVMLGLPGSAYLYQGEELGLPEHTTLDDDLRQDPTWSRSAHTERGRDGCRVPLPWAKDEAGCGSHVAPVGEKPNPASSFAHGSGTRQPSRPRSVCPERDHVGSWRKSSSSVVCSGRPSSSPW